MRRFPPVLAVLAVLVLFSCFAAMPAADAHEDVPGIRNVLDEIDPPLPEGVRFEVVISAADQVVITNTTDREVTVPGAEGEPFLLIGPDGVRANLRSPTWYRSVNPDEGSALPPEVAADASPRFVLVSRQASWGWFDHRLHRRTIRTAPAAAPGETVRLEDWTIPFRVDGVEYTARGHREYSRPTGSFVAQVTSAPDALAVSVLGGGVVPALVATQRGSETIELVDPDGIVFARLDRDGMAVNEASTLWRLTAAVRATGGPPDGPVGPGANDHFVVYDSGGQLIWLEPRAVYPKSQPPDDISSSQPTVVDTWTVPVRVDGDDDAITGTLSWVPAGTRAGGQAAAAASGGTSRLRWLLPVVAGVLLAGIAVGRRRRGT